MREIIEPEPAASKVNGQFILVAAISGTAGAFIGAFLFPTIETQFVEKRVEVPVEVIKYVDRMVEKVVERRVEVPVEKVVYRPAAAERDPLDEGHRALRQGMHRSQVFTLVGRPYFDDGSGILHYYSVSSRMNLRLRFDGDLLVEIIYPK